MAVSSMASPALGARAPDDVRHALFASGVHAAHVGCKQPGLSLSAYLKQNSLQQSLEGGSARRSVGCGVSAVGSGGRSGRAGPSFEFQSQRVVFSIGSNPRAAASR